MINLFPGIAAMPLQPLSNPMDFKMLMNRLLSDQNEPIYGQAAARLTFGDRTLLEQDL